MTAPIPLLTVREVAQVLKCGRTTVHDLIRRKKLRSLKVGRLRRVRVTDLDRYLSAARG